MPSDREGLEVAKRFKFPVPSADGTRLEVREFQPGEFLPRQAWDLAPARSRRTMTNTGFVRDPLTVEINPITGTPDPVPVGKPATVVVHGYDRREAERQAKQRQQPEKPAPKRRGRPPKQKA